MRLFLVKYRFVLLGLFGVFLLAFVLRVWGIDNGLPNALTTGESDDLRHAITIARLEVPKFTYHRVLFPMLQVPVHGLHFVLSKLANPTFSFSDFEGLYFTNRASFVIHARILTAFLSALVVIPMYLIGTGLTDKRSVGWLMAVIAGVQPGMVYHAHYALPDSVSLTWVALVFLAVIWIVKGDRWGYVLAGISSALVILTRLQAAPILICIPMAHVVWWYQNDRSIAGFFMPLIRAGIAFGLANLILNPYILLQPSAILRDFRFLLDVHWNGGGSSSNLITKISRNRSYPQIAISTVLMGGASIGFVFALIKRDIIPIIIGISGVLFTVAILPAGWVRITYWLPAVVPAIILTSYGLSVVIAAPQTAISRSGYLVLGLMLASMVFQTVQINRIMSATNTRSAMAQWVEENLEADSRILQGNEFILSIPLARNLSSIERLDDRERSPRYTFYLQNPAEIPEPAYNLFGNEYLATIRSDEDFWQLVAEYDIQYVIEADYCGGALNYGNVSSATFPYISADVRSQLELVHFISPFGEDECLQYIPPRNPLELMQLSGWERVGPLMRVYNIPKIE